MRVYYLSSDNLEKFREKIEENLDKYKSGKLTFVKANDLIGASKIMIEDFKFDMSKKEPSSTDYENIKRFYLAFKNLKDTPAAEEMLWAGLCHYTPFWDYIKYRWDCKTEKNVLDRYFFGEGSRSKFYNGLARLWWYGRMTYDEKAKDPFELTKYICENLTTKGLLTMTFAFSHNRRICQTYLRAMMNFEKKYKLTEEEYLQTRIIINLWGGNILLDSLTDIELTDKLNSFLEKLINKRGEVKQKKSKSKTKKITDHSKKECPKCKRKADGKEEIEKYFGFRKMNGKSVPQSQCKKCRSSKKKS